VLADAKRRDAAMHDLAAVGLAAVAARQIDRELTSPRCDAVRKRSGTTASSDRPMA